MNITQKPGNKKIIFKKYIPKNMYQYNQIKELKTKIDYYEEENNELKNLVNDFKKEKKKLMEEKNTLISQYKEQIQKIKNVINNKQ